MTNWKKHEKQTATEFSGQRQRGSGNHWAHKLDVKTDDYLIENKATAKKSYTLTQLLWDKIYKAAVLDGRIGLLALRFERKDKPDLDLVVLDKNDFIELTTCSQNDNI